MKIWGHSHPSFSEKMNSGCSCHTVLISPVIIKMPGPARDWIRKDKHSFPKLWYLQYIWKQPIPNIYKSLVTCYSYKSCEFIEASNHQTYRLSANIRVASWRRSSSPGHIRIFLFNWLFYFKYRNVKSPKSRVLSFHIKGVV
jgi:hypothetical protein